MGLRGPLMSDARQHVHELIDQLDASQLEAGGHLLEIITHDDDEDLTEKDRAAIQAGLASLEKNGGIPMEDILADFGLTTAEFETLTAGSEVQHIVTKRGD
jgi:hypothetical protein